jgi:hypothetical protein
MRFVHDIFGFAFAVVVPKQQCAAWIVDKLCALVALQTQTSQTFSSSVKNECHGFCTGNPPALGCWEDYYVGRLGRIFPILKLGERVFGSSMRSMGRLEHALSRL